MINKTKEQATIQLENMCEKIVKEIETGDFEFNENSDYDDLSAGNYLHDMLDCRYIVNSNKEYMGAYILVDFDVPIWINTLEKCVEGHLGSDVVKRYYCNDKIGLCDYMEKLYEC